MQIEIDEETGALVTGIAIYLNELDGGIREPADIVKWSVSAAMSVRPDIISALSDHTDAEIDAQEGDN